jgi:tRNA pseudouridine55 synthase
MNEIIPQTINQIILVDKPVGISSFDCIRNLKREFPRKTKIGHAGTLDPFASGLMLILIGSATKRQDEIHKLKKVYRVVAKFNASTNSYDRTGEIVDTDNLIFSKEEMEKCIDEHFVGLIKQTPPSFSAVHVNGQRAYDLARNGVEFKLSQKKVSVYSFKILKFEYPFVEFEIECGSGTYIRSLVHDLAKKLGGNAYCEKLRRISIGEYNIKDAIKLKGENYEG